MERASASRSTLARRSRWDSEWVSVSIAGPAACSAPEGSPIPLCGRIQLVGRAAGRRGAAMRAAGPPGGWGPQARGELSRGPAGRGALISGGGYGGSDDADGRGAGGVLRAVESGGGPPPRGAGRGPPSPQTPPRPPPPPGPARPPAPASLEAGGFSPPPVG